MTGQEQQQQPSAFAERADTAGLAIKGELSQRLGISLPETKVQVGPNGQPPQPPPPEGSYARQMWDQQQAQLAQQQQQLLRQQAMQPNPQPQQSQVQADGQQVQQLPPGQPAQGGEQVSANAQRRITELVSQLREKDQTIQQLQTGQAQNTQSVQELQARLEAQTAQYEEMVKQNLDNLDPETRMQVLNSAAIRQAVAESEQRILGAIQPRFAEIQERTLQQEFGKLAANYGGFRAEEHIPLIQAFRERNPHCTAEQAFRAVATAQELGVPSVPAPPVPPVVPPGSGSSTPRYVPQPGSDPEQEMREEAAQARDLARSSDPKDQKKAQQLFHKNLTDRLGAGLPGQQ